MEIKDILKSRRKDRQAQKKELLAHLLAQQPVFFVNSMEIMGFEPKQGGFGKIQ